MALNDAQFCAFMTTATDLNTNQIYKVFDMLDVDGSGAMDFDEFYLLICILIAVQDKAEKNFIYRHSRTVFDLLDEDSSGNISAYEFETFGFLFNLQGEAIRTIFGEFDVSGDQVCKRKRRGHGKCSMIDHSDKIASLCRPAQPPSSRQIEERGLVYIQYTNSDIFCVSRKHKGLLLQFLKTGIFL